MCCHRYDGGGYHIFLGNAETIETPVRFVRCLPFTDFFRTPSPDARERQVVGIWAPLQVDRSTGHDDNSSDLRSNLQSEDELTCTRDAVVGVRALVAVGCPSDHVRGVKAPMVPV